MCSEITGRRLPTRSVAERYSVSTRTVERWAADPRLRFPKPLIIRRLKYWLEAELTQWERDRAAGVASGSTGPP